MIRKLLGWFLMAAMSLLSGCGGGGGDGGESPFPGDTSSVAELRVALSASQLVNDGSSSVLVTVTAVNSANQVLSGVPVLVTANSAAVTTVASTTDSSGQLLATVGLGGDATIRTVTVTATSGTKSGTASFQVVSGTTSSTAVADLRMVFSASAILPGGSTTATITAVNASNQVVADAPVVFSTNTAGITITAGSTKTDSSGQISAQVSASSSFASAPAAVVITAVATGSGARRDGTLTIADRVVAEQSVSELRMALNTSTLANASGGVITATVTAVNANGVVVVGAPVVVTSAGVGGQAAGVVTTVNELTGADGTMSSTIGYGTITTPRTIQVTAKSNGKVAVASFNVVDGSTSGAPTLALNISSTTVSAANPPTVTAQLLDAAGSPYANQVVTLTAKRNLAVFSAATVLTNASGQGSAIVYPVSNSTSGADEIVATVVVGSTTYSASLGFQVTPSTVSITNFVTDKSSVEAYGQANLSVDLSTVAGTPVSLSVSSVCLNKGKAKITPTSQTVTGSTATFTYVDDGCGATDANDTVTVTLVGTTKTAALSLGLGSPAASSLGFVSATPEVIYLKGSGFTEESVVKFVVKDQAGAALPGRSVVLTPTTLAGGLTLNGGSGAVTLLSDANGQVSVRVNSGTVPTPVRVQATLKDTTISTVSSNLSIRVGLPSQLNFSMSQNTINIEGMDRDGTANSYSIIASDRMGNPVPAGTAINFITEGGQVEATQQIALSGGLARATAAFVSSEPRPVDGRVTVAAYAIGEESFLDLNGNNIFDTDEKFQDLGDLFVSRMFKDTYEADWDQYVSLSLSSGSSCTPTVSADTTGLLALNASIPSVTKLSNAACRGHDNVWGRAYVRRAVETVFSTSSSTLMWFRAGAGVPANISGGVMDSGCRLVNRTNQALLLRAPETVIVGGAVDVDATIAGLMGSSDAALRNKVSTFYQLGAGETIYGLPVSGFFSLVVADSNSLRLNPMPAGTIVSAAATQGISTAVTGGSPVANTSGITGATVSFQFTDATSGAITVTTQSPSGLRSSHTFGITMAAKPATVDACAL